MKKSLNPYWLVGCLIFLVIILLSFSQLIPESDKNLNVELKQIYDSSLNHLNKIAEKPHNYGSLEKENVKNYIISTIEKYGYKAILQKGPLIKNEKLSDFSYKTVFAIVENIYVEIPGKTQDKIAIVTHYDSVPFGPGAADNSTAVASNLANFEKVCKDIQKGIIPLNSIIFIFTDAEEMGLLGAEYFTKNYEEIYKISLVLNLDARGNKGKNILFQSNDKNGKIIKQYSKFDKKIIGFSFANDIYKRMPNSTDFTPFLNKKIDGLNFAFLQNSIVYHSFLDNIKDLSKNSLVETNLKIYNFINAFSNFNFSNNNDYKQISNDEKNNDKIENKTKNENYFNKDKNPYIYFSLFGSLLIFSKTFYFILLLALFIIILFFIIFSIIKNIFSLKEFFISLSQNLIFFILFGLLLFLAKIITYLLFPITNVFYITPYNEHLYFIFIYAIALFIIQLIASRYSKFINFYSFYIASSFFSFILSMIVIKFVPGISLIFILQSFTFMLIFIIILLFKFYNSKLEENLYYLFHFIPSILAFSVGLPFSYLTYISLGLKNIAFTFIGVFPIVPIFMGAYNKVKEYDKKIVTIFLFLVLITFTILIINNYNYNQDRPMLSSMNIEKDLDTSELSIILPYNEAKYSNNPWHKSILSLGKVNVQNNIYIIEELKDIKLQNCEFFKILNQSENKRFKDYEIEIYSNSWSFTMPAGSQIFINDILNISYEKVSTFKGYTPYGQAIKVKIRIPVSEILKFNFINYFFQNDYNINLPLRPSDLLGVYDYIVVKGTLK